MSALLTYRSRDSFESRFGRKIPDPSRRQNINGVQRPSTPSSEHWAIHNDGHRNAGSPRPSRNDSDSSLASPDGRGRANAAAAAAKNSDPEFHGTPGNSSPAETPRTQSKQRTPTYFSAQSYLRYQGEKFIKRFDANCYIAITRKLDTHDVSRGRVPDSSEVPILDALALIEQPTLILGIESDGLFTFAEQQDLAKGIKDSVLKKIDSSEGHDAFLLEFEQVNNYVLEFLNEKLSDIMARTPKETQSINGEPGLGVGGEAIGVTKSSTFGEAEVDDITAW